MSMSQTDIDSAAREVIAAKLARGVAHVEVEMILNGQPGGQTYSMPELSAIRFRVRELFAAYIEAIKPEVPA